jgi:DNA-binding protein YbaB
MARYAVGPNTRAVVPTEAGNLFADYARGMTEQFAHAQRELQDREHAFTARDNGKTMAVIHGDKQLEGAEIDVTL